MSHWYSKEGESKYEVPQAKDPTKMRDTTLRDARKPENQWLPSVTTILSEMQGKQQLVKWMKDQVATAAATMTEAERSKLSPDDLVKKILLDADEYAEKARVKGGLLHDSIEVYAKSGELPENPETLRLFEPFMDWWDKNIEEVFQSEGTFVGYGYAGRVDLIARLRNGKIFVLDWKTRKRGSPTTKAEKVAGYGKYGKYIEDLYQLAAYRDAIVRHGIKIDGVANVLIDSSNATPVEFREYPKEDVDRMAKSWACKVADWQFSHDYFPQVERGSDEDIFIEYILGLN